MGKRCFTVQPVEILPSSDQELAGMTGTDAEERGRPGSSSEDQ